MLTNELKKLGVEYAENHELNKSSKVILTGSLALDNIMGGGIPIGRIIELYGWESSGKSLILYSILAQCQKAGGVAILSDAEKAYIPQWGEMHGIDNSKLLYSSPNSVEDFFRVLVKVMEAVHRGNTFAVFGLDSVAALCSEEDNLDGGGYHTKRAIMMSRGLSTLCRDFHKFNMALIFVNQLRDKMGGGLIKEETTPGGNSIKFFASLRLKTIGKKADKGEDGNTQGITTKVKVVKSKICIPHRVAEIYLSFNNGIDRYCGLLELLVKDKVVEHEKGSTWYAINGEKFQRGQFIEVYREHMDTPYSDQGYTEERLNEDEEQDNNIST